MKYLADTVTIIRHFSKTGKVGKNARSLLKGADKGQHHIFISVLSKRKRQALHLGKCMMMVKH